MVLAIALMMVTAGSALAVNAMAHDPLVQTDAAEHYAYRGLEAGINSYLSTVNARPDLVDCSSTSTATTCTTTDGGISYDTWTLVPQTTTTDNVPEYYLWTNPQLCFSTSKSTETQCTASPTTSHGNFEYLKVEIIGAAGYTGHFVYQSSVVYFSAGQGFLTRIWWSNYESTYTHTGIADPTTSCKYNWKTTTYDGKDGSCGPIIFAGKTVIDGPVFSNDSIYVGDTQEEKPVFGTPTTSTVDSPVTTADPNCLFVLATTNDKKTCTKVPKDDVTRYTTVNSHYDTAVEPIPTSDSTLLPVAQVDGCAYLGPTTISLYETGKTQYMNVTSPETPVETTGHDEENDAGNVFNKTHKCVGTHIAAPTTAHSGNGVLFVATSTSTKTDCKSNGDNPFDGTRQGKATAAKPNTIEAQIVAADKFPGTTKGYVYPDGEKSTGSQDCEGDVFVRDADKSNTPTGDTGGIAGNLTIAAQDNVIITGSLKYTDCGTTFESKYKYAKTCKYTPKSGHNDSLGLIATDFVEVNRPGDPSCKHPQKSNGHGGETTTDTKTECDATPASIFASCSTTVSDLTAVLCNPGPTLVIDAAVLALKHAFAVNDYTVNQDTKDLYVYGSIDQDWRGAVGEPTNPWKGYEKHYVWDSRLPYVTIPHYLTPSTASWDLASSSVELTTGCPKWPKPYPTGSTTTPHKDDIATATTKGPTGASGAC